MNHKFIRCDYGGNNPFQYSLHIVYTNLLFMLLNIRKDETIHYAFILQMCVKKAQKHKLIYKLKMFAMNRCVFLLSNPLKR